MPAFSSQSQSITALWVLISRPIDVRRLSWPRWLGEILRWFARRRRSPISVLTSTVDRRQGSDRPRSASTNENIDQMNDMVERYASESRGPARTHSTVREISRKIGIPKSSVVRIIRKDLQLKCFKRRRAQELTEANCTNGKLLLLGKKTC